MDRLIRKFETAKKLVPAPVRRNAKQPTRFGALYFGSTTPAMKEALESLDERGIYLDTLRVRGFPFSDEVMRFIAEHDKVFVVEQNRDAQLRTLLINEGSIDPARVVPVLHYDGTPITARFIISHIAEKQSRQTADREEEQEGEGVKHRSRELDRRLVHRGHPIEDLDRRRNGDGEREE